ncbi:HD domain-containing protein [Candidatus Tisiphia endosymbiont of Sialis lutaria]|uniref:HD domain-containing protein n=1 Tax=Candidatus Tisiphia endosymbiont of Sialis lutaria TaxID=2029164 RepID=UPI00312CBB70
MKEANCWKSQFETCCYSNKLLDKLLLLNDKTDTIDILKVKKAIYYAKEYHGKQKRDSGEPFYSHPIEVVCIFTNYTSRENIKFFRTDLLVTCVLHDTIEDTEITEKIIANNFGKLVASQVQDLTRIKMDRKISSKEMVESLWLQGKYDILLIKLCDRIHNMQTIEIKPPEKIKKIIQETKYSFLPLAKYFGSTIENELRQLCLKPKL